MAVCVLIQARMSSTRLPGKVMATVVGKPLLSLMIERVKQSHLVDEIVVVTSTHPEDSAIDLFCHQHNIHCFRGALNDVLGRFVSAIEAYPDFDHYIRLTADCPLIDPDIIDQIFQFHLEGQFDYSSNCFNYSLPDGLDVEIFTKNALLDSAKRACLMSEREHVTLFIRSHPECYSLGKWEYAEPFGGRWTVDYPEDLKFVTTVFESLYKKMTTFGFKDIRLFLREHPEVVALNKNIELNEGLKKSQASDQFVKVDEYGKVPELD